MAVVQRAAIKQKREHVLFYFYFSFIAVVQAALVLWLTSHVAQSCYSVIGDKPLLWSKAK